MKRPSRLATGRATTAEGEDVLLCSFRSRFELGELFEIASLGERPSIFSS